MGKQTITTTVIEKRVKKKKIPKVNMKDVKIIPSLSDSRSNRKMSRA